MNPPTNPPLSLIRTIGVRRVLVVATVAAAVVVVAVANRCGGPTGPGSAHPARTTIALTGPAGPAPAASDTPSTLRSASTGAPSPVDDGTSARADQPATITNGPADPREAAAEFAATWLNTLGKTPEQWRTTLTSMITPQLADLLANADPATVPAGRVGVVGRPTPAGDALVQVPVPVVTSGGASSGAPVGTLTLTLTGASHRWLVSEIDWTPA
jgi:hypothetical protein